MSPVIQGKEAIKFLKRMKENIIIVGIFLIIILSGCTTEIELNEEWVGEWHCEKWIPTLEGECKVFEQYDLERCETIMQEKCPDCFGVWIPCKEIICSPKQECVSRIWKETRKQVGKRK